MPPKKAAAPSEEKIWLGRPKNNVTIGLVGLPNVGKSSLFNQLGNLQVAAENYPFCTIDPADATVEVPDMRFEKLCEAWKPKSEVRAVLKVTDIAGLVKGASEGKGLGSAFLSHIQQVDAIYHVCRAFIKKDIEHVEGEVDSVRDLEIIRGELIKKDLEWICNHVESIKKKLRAKKDRDVEDNLAAIEKCVELLKEGKEIRAHKWTAKEASYIVPCPLLSAKPVVVLANVSTQNYEKGQNKFMTGIMEWVSKECPDDPVIPYSISYEEKIAAMGEEERATFVAENKPSKLPQIIKSGYKALGLINFFTVGPDEVRSWSLRAGSKAPQAAGVIHGDFEKHFICAEVYSFKDFKENKFSEKEVKDKGLIRTKGKDYVVQDGDIILFKHNAGGAGKK